MFVLVVDMYILVTYINLLLCLECGSHVYPKIAKPSTRQKYGAATLDTDSIIC